MNVPTGYTALDLVGFTDKGAYSGSTPYVKNDLVHYNGTIWRCKVDDTTGVIPSEGVNWTVFIENDNTTAQRMIAPIETSPSTHTYSIGESLVYGGVLYEVKAAIAIGDSLTVNTNIEASDDIEKQIRDLIGTVDNVADDLDDLSDTVSENGAHNLLPFPYSENGTISRSGTVFVVSPVSPKGIITVSGTPNADPGYSYLSLLTMESNKGAELGLKFAGKQIRVNGGFSRTATASEIRLQVEGYDSSNNRVLYEEVIGVDKQITVPNNTAKLGIYLTVTTNFDGADIIVKPLICLASDHSTGFYPFAPTNQDLAGVIPTMLKNGAHNLCPFPYSQGGSQTIRSVAFTVSSKGILSANGSANLYGSFFFFADKKLDIGIYKFMFVGSFSGEALPKLEVYDRTTNRTVASTSNPNEFIYLQIDSSNENHTFSFYLGWSRMGSLVVNGGPIMCVEEDPSSDFGQYTMTNAELTETVKNKDVAWEITATDLSDFLNHICSKAYYDIGFVRDGDSFTGTAVWSGHDYFSFIVRREQATLYEIMAWRDAAFYTGRYVPNTSFVAYEYTGTQI